ncbi:c-type cytochrome biogenesis protein CcmI [Thalassotalea sp. M1531]|uniref:C-type cytochrome biogenesis protein CcmI n=1 Tax=Thalassotalea algicola TaxID=2716224 RepID=A0A7Y0L9I9_9GAMM|nr:c-type cytochrome biogenesis protein CcmI [Thalassotalea algicola]NMP30262.1 c-type cytochrome biogenesis protein CcmI [Thalassotalea algicola]
MIDVLVIIIVFVLLLLAVIWWHYLSSAKGDAESLSGESREHTNISLYKEHKAEIEKDYAEGNIDQENYEYLLAELDKSLLQDIEQSKQEQETQEKSSHRMSVLWPVGLSIFVIAFSVLLYSKQGAYKQLAEPQAAMSDHSHQDDQTAMHSQLDRIKKALEENPNDPDALYSLAQLYISAGEFEQAISAFDKVIAIEGEHADLIGAKAQATYYAANQKITPEVQALIDKALAINPNDPSTNILLGMHHFIEQSYQQAIDYWQKVADTGSEAVNVDALKEAITEAKSRMALTNGNQGEEAVTGPQINVAVELGEEVLEKLIQGEDKVVFIYAVPAEGGRMPLAAVKLMASDLPTQVVLNDSRAMTPEMKLSGFEQVNIYAVVSKLGGAGIKSGDYKAEINNVSVNTTDIIQLKIDTIVP